MVGSGRDRGLAWLALSPQPARSPACLAKAGRRFRAPNAAENRFDAVGRARIDVMVLDSNELGQNLWRLPLRPAIGQRQFASQGGRDFLAVRPGIGCDSAAVWCVAARSGGVVRPDPEGWYWENCV
jgi:hypothetical protein